ncbi:GNAT family N-acetyltransferase [Streptomyces sp. NPDC006552]|uniref:GNAT family N-acetyltransferase n=1 Tax=Streptomyces sp. NPDC006552 TaxID=3157179 RepID=UPI0033A65EBE
MTGHVEVQLIDDATLEDLLAVAVQDATPDEVMPPVAGPPGWTASRQDAFRQWHQARREGLHGPSGEATYAIRHDGSVVGSGRLALHGGHDVLETGMWLGRPYRGCGIGTAALALLLAQAAQAGARTVVAETTRHNDAALAALRRNGATLDAGRSDDAVHAELLTLRDV